VCKRNERQKNICVEVCVEIIGGEQWQGEGKGLYVFPNEEGDLTCTNNKRICNTQGNELVKVSRGNDCHYVKQ